MKHLLIGLVAVLALAGCAAPAPGPWQKPGTTDAEVAADSAQCRGMAQQQAARSYPYGSANLAVGAGMIAAQQQTNTNRTSAELEIFNDCMEARGYTRVQKPPG